MVSGAIAIGTSLIGAKASDRASKRADKRAEAAQRRFANTGRSSFDTRTGRIKIDPSIRRETALQKNRVAGFRPQVEGAFQRFGTGLAGIRERLGGLTEAFEDSAGEFAQSIIDPAQEAAARIEGQTARELGRRKVFGTFGEGAKAIAGREAQRTVTDARVQAERERINTLSNFLEMDSNLLQAGLESETGRIKMLENIEGILAGFTQDEFNRETELLNIGSGVGARSAGLDAAAASSAGVAAQQRLNLAGSVLGAAGDVIRGAGSSGVARRPVAGASFTQVADNPRGFVGGL